MPASGMVLEFGVFSGTSINRIASQMPGRRVYGFDSFEGLPETWRPGFGQGKFKRTDLPTVSENVELVIGWFDNTLPAFVASNPDEKLALLHVDCDLYSSTKTIFAFLADRIVPGTIIIFDEYFNYPEWRIHEYKAFLELRLEHVIAYEYIGLVPSHQQVVVRVTSVG
jgi:predicted O-methyltransferase YrrM